MIKLFCLALLSLLVIIFPFQAFAQTEYRLQRYPVVADGGEIIGTVHVQRVGDVLRMDFDFAGSSACQLESITTRMDHTGETRTYRVESSEGTTLSEFENTYIAPRDAVVAYHVGGMNANDELILSSELTFNCSGRSLRAWVGSDQVDQNGYCNFTYQANVHNQSYYTSGSSSTNGNYYYNDSDSRTKGGSNYYYSQPTSSVRSGQRAMNWYEGKTSGDGYVLRYDERNDWWYWEDVNQRNQQVNTNNRGWFEGKTSGDGYVLQYNDAQKYWYWAQQ